MFSDLLAASHHNQHSCDPFVLSSLVSPVSSFLVSLSSHVKQTIQSQNTIYVKRARIFLFVKSFLKKS